MKKRLVILGAGQMGSAALRLINENNIEAVAFGDNSGPYPRSVFGVEVMPVKDAIKKEPDAVLAAVASPGRAAELKAQAESLGYEGDFLLLSDFAAAMDIRRASIILAAERIKEGNVPGAVAELGVYRGETARVLNALFPERKLYLFDTFESFNAQDVAAEEEKTGKKIRSDEFSDTSVELVLSVLPHPEQAIIKKGWFPGTAKGLNEEFAFVSLDADLYAPTLSGLEYFVPRLSSGGVIFLHDYNNPRFSGVKQAVRDFEEEYGRLALMPLGDLHGTVMIAKV